MIKGRKRHIITDTMSLLLAVVVHAANVHDSKGASDVIALLKGRFERLVKFVADGGYRGIDARDHLCNKDGSQPLQDGHKIRPNLGFFVVPFIAKDCQRSA